MSGMASLGDLFGHAFNQRPSDKSAVSGRSRRANWSPGRTLETRCSAVGEPFGITWETHAARPVARPAHMAILDVERGCRRRRTLGAREALVPELVDLARL